MTSEQTLITEAIVQAAGEAARAAVQAMAMANTDNSKRIQNAILKICGPMMKQPTFDWEADVKYVELKNIM